jgi:H+/Cl- antiporter ClcA
MVLPVAYLGALIAPAGVLSIPFQIFHKHHFPAWAFWITAALVGTLAGRWLFRAVVCGWRFFRQRVIHLEALVFAFGLVFAVIVIIWLYPPK